MIRSGAAALALAAAVALPALAGTHPSRLQVSAREFNFALSKQSIRPGRTILELVNYGEDSHDLRLRRIGGKRVYRLAETKPGNRSELDFRVAPGRYRLWCSIADHRQRGMSAVLTVR